MASRRTGRRRRRLLLFVTWRLARWYVRRRTRFARRVLGGGLAVGALLAAVARIARRILR